MSQHDRLVRGIRELYSRTVAAAQMLNNNTTRTDDHDSASRQPTTVYSILDSLGLLIEDRTRDRLGAHECVLCGQDIPSSLNYCSSGIDCDYSLT